MTGGIVAWQRALRPDNGTGIVFLQPAIIDAVFVRRPYGEKAGRPDLPPGDQTHRARRKYSAMRAHGVGAQLHRVGRLKPGDAATFLWRLIVDVKLTCSDSVAERASFSGRPS